MKKSNFIRLMNRLLKRFSLRVVYINDNILRYESYKIITLRHQYAIPFDKNDINYKCPLLIKKDNENKLLDEIRHFIQIEKYEMKDAHYFTLKLDILNKRNT